MGKISHNFSITPRQFIFLYNVLHSEYWKVGLTLQQRIDFKEILDNNQYNESQRIKLNHFVMRYKRKLKRGVREARVKYGSFENGNTNEKYTI